ncbi:LOW QUALITY PROTEIN: protocadherin alpha-8-like isoform X1 [Cricetulus griseus]|uniref:LOW QUALITY PROTEIN: protocadherin alpha-8-like isoform X1 n=1 Tax=Cricetulus griseus TaxID=10029 RepID=UPI0007DA6E7A|nr:LOW QUALITY PROTEIN: protocadherin alpha-8-like isoform X1 [Cricetulus griseus]
MVFSWRGGPDSRRLLLSLWLFTIWEAGSGQLHYSVPEEAKHGTFVGRIAQDLGLELAELVPRLFRVASKDRGDLLEVNLQNGILFVNSRIDREALCGRSAECSIHLEVIVDRPLQVFHVEVEVRDINDNPPVFSVKEQKLYISESRMLDSRFLLEGASDADIGANSIVTYRLDSNDYFTLIVNSKNEENKQVELVLRKSLDREDAPEHKLLLTATDGGKPELTGSVQLLVTVLDVNDNAPTFQQSEYEVRILENSDNGTTVIRLNASDRDEGTNSAISYSFNRLVPSMVLEQFSIDTDTGEIIIQGNLDFEQVNVYKIRVDATDKGHPPMAGHCTVLVKVLDENDNVPQVTLTSLSLPVREDAALGTVIALISVSDLDSGANGQVTCSLTPHVPFKLVSTFKNYYSLVLDSALDRETTADYKVVVTARDGGSPSLWATASVSVEVADVNDNAPAFAQPEYTVFVKENNPPGAHIFTVSATDADVQENALVSYSLVERRVGERLLSSFVSVHAESGKVFALQPLDHEELELLQFQVSARDAGVPALGSNVTLQVFVLDENDNAPTLLLSGTEGLGSMATDLIPKSVSAGQVVAKVRAVDSDSGYNAWLSYELQPSVGPRSPFRVGLYTGEISTTRALDELDAPRQRLLVLVKDHGEPALTATATVLVSLVESNQVPKASSQASGRSSVPEVSLVDVNVYLIIAICAVSSLLVLTLLLYTALRCSATPTEGACAPGKPVLVCSSAVGSWSYSQQRRQRVCSGEGPPKANLMAFSPSLPPRPGSEVIGEVQDLNVDHGFQVSRGGDPEGWHLVLSLLIFTVWEVGSGQLHYSIAEEAKHGTFVGRIVQDLDLQLPELVPGALEGASDADVGENAMLTYKLSSNDFFILDIVNKKGKGELPVLVLRKLIDREENPQLKLLLTATDGGKPEFTGSVSLLIQVLDAPDNAPVFDKSVYEVKMSENQENQTLVIWLNATDTDEGINKEVEYSFSSLTPSSIRKKFLINEQTGEIKVNGAIDFEDSNSYEIHVDATDKGHPPMVAHCTVLVEILDENDNAPEIVLTFLSDPVKEDALLGTVIALISVSDRDSGANGQVTCSLTPHVPFKLVSTFKNYYSLVLDSALDRETTADYKVVVTARDGGSPSLWATASVSVEVADVNDNAPAFAQPEYTVFVKENNPPGAHIFTVSATDADVQENALVSYSLVERRVGERLLSSFVSVHAESGKVFALQPLDHEELELLQFQVSARDAGVPALGSNVTLQVFVLDENDNAPVLLGSGTGGADGVFNQLLTRSVDPGHVVTKVRAVDADSGYNAWLSYELQPWPGSTRSPFRVGLYTGEISTTRALDEGDGTRQRLLVLVKDHGEPPLTATVTVLVSLVENGQAPKVSSRSSVGATVPESSLVDVNVYLIIAICAVSSLLVLTLLLYTALRCSSAPTGGVCGPGKPVLVCSSAVGTWSYSQQRQQRVCSGEGPHKTDLMAFSPGLPPCPGSVDGSGEPSVSLDSHEKEKLHYGFTLNINAY